jgi:FkbM family methyltransferase
MLWFDPEPTFEKHGYPTGVLHVGACDGEEQFLYDRWGVKHVAWFEPNKEKVSKMLARGLEAYGCALGAKAGMMTLHMADNGQSSSLLKPTKHLEMYPDIKFEGAERVVVRPLDDFSFPPDYDMLVIDTQGFELEVLKGSARTLGQLRYIYTEVYTEELYEGCGMFPEIQDLLVGWTLEGTWWETGRGWGDAFFSKV